LLQWACFHAIQTTKKRCKKK